MIYQTGSNWQELVDRHEAMKWAGPDLLACQMSEDLRVGLIASRRGRACWRLVRIYTAVARRPPRRDLGRHL